MLICWVVLLSPYNQRVLVPMWFTRKLPLNAMELSEERRVRLSKEKCFTPRAQNKFGTVVGRVEWPKKF